MKHKNGKVKPKDNEDEEVSQALIAIMQLQQELDEKLKALSGRVLMTVAGE